MSAPGMASPCPNRGELISCCPRSKALLGIRPYFLRFTAEVIISRITILSKKAKSKPRPGRIKARSANTVPSFSGKDYVAREVTEIMETNRSLRESEASLRSLCARILQLQDQERRRIARDLHDTTGQELAVIVMSLKHLSNSLDQPGFDARKAIAEVSELARQVNDEIRTLSYLLHPPLLDEFGLGYALKWYVEGFNKRSGIDVTLEVSEKLPRFASDKEMALFRVVQESLTNVMRHSGSRKAWIRVTQNRGVVQVGVEDEGSGIDAAILGRLARGPKALGVGIPGLRERLRQLGGRLEISSSSGGTRLVAVLPAESAASVTDDASQLSPAESSRDSHPLRRRAGPRNLR